MQPIEYRYACRWQTQYAIMQPNMLTHSATGYDGVPKQTRGIFDHTPSNDTQYEELRGQRLN